jgi:hypothetical protein
MLNFDDSMKNDVNDIIVVVIGELHNSWKEIIVTKL